MSLREVSDIGTYEINNPLSADTASVLDEREKEIAATGNADSEMAMDMAEVWKDFPLELHQHILQNCPVPELCRLRMVCCAWNDLTHHTHFASTAQVHCNRYICTSSELKCTVTDRFALRRSMNRSLSNSWELIDVSTKKVYRINKEFLYDGLLAKFASMDTDGIPDRTWSVHGKTMAADKGLLCVLWRSSGGEIMQIVNPVTRSVIEVPLFKRDWNAYSHAKGAMTVAEGYSSFTLYFMFNSFQGKLSLLRFDSQVGNWRELSSQPAGTDVAMHLLKLNESLYMLQWDDLEMQLFAFNTVSETWSDTPMELPTKWTKWEVMPQLVTVLGRLFIVISNNDIDFSVEILEIDVVSKTHSILTTTGDEFSGSLDCIQKEEFRRTNTAVVGCGNFIVLASGTGRSIAFDVLNNVWIDWSLTRWMSVYGRRHGLFGMAMTLTLHPVPRVQHY